MKQNKIRTYHSDFLFQQGLKKIFALMFKDVVQNKELIWRLFLRDVTARHKQSLLGWLWIVFLPLTTMLTFLLLNMSGIISIGDIKIPYPIYGLLSFAIWNLFANGLARTTTSITGAGAMIGKINFSKTALVFASTGQVILDFLIRLIITLLVCLIYQQALSWLIIIFPLALIPLFILTLGFGFIASIFNTIMKDAIQFINLILNFLLLLMPIMYSFPEKGLLVALNRYNPLYFLITTPRDMILYGEINNLTQFFLSSLLALIIFFFGWAMSYLSQAKLAERI